MDGLSTAASVIAVIQLAQSIGGFLKDLYRDIRDARTEINRHYDSIISLEIIAKGLDDLVKCRGAEMLNASLLEDPQGPLKQALLELKFVKERLDVQAVDSRFEKMVLSVKHSVQRSLKWPFKKEEVLSIIARVEKHKSNLLLDVDINTLSLQFRHSDILQDIKRDISAARQDSHRRQLIEWLSRSVPDPSFEHNKALNLHEETTGSWLIDGDSFQHWITAPNSYLWVYGSAGAGKSVLCSTAIEHIQSICKDEPNSAVVYWYFTFRDSSSQNVHHCLQSLVANLCSKRADTPKALQEAYEQSNNGQLSPSTKALLHLLNAAIEGFENVYIFIDALDECPMSGKKQERERDELMDRLHEICGWKKDCLHILTTSRKEKDIEESLKDLSQEVHNFDEISVQGDLVERDIRKYIEQSFRARQFRSWKLDLKEEVETKLATQANGMFRLVALQFDVLLKSGSVAAIRRALASLPVTLDEFYDYILETIDKEHQRHASIALQWLAYSTRPLSLSELAEAIVIQPGTDPCFDPDERLVDETQLLEFLPAGLVRISNQEQPNSDGRWLPDGKKVPFVEFAHFSVLEFLKSSRIHPALLDTFQVKELKAHRMMAESCLLYLLHIGENEGKLSIDMLELQQLDEASSSSSEVDEEAIEDAEEDPSEEIPRILSSPNDKPLAVSEASYNLYCSKSIAIWESWRVLCQHLDDRSPRRLSGEDYFADLQFLHDSGRTWTIWCWFCFEEEFHFRRQNNFTYLKREAERSTESYKELGGLSHIHPVTWISNLGFPLILALLLRKYPDHSNIERPPSYGSPLHAASSRGHLQVIQTLLSDHADTNEEGGQWRNPLCAAVRSGSLEVVRFLIRGGADVNSAISVSPGGPAFVMACTLGFLNIVKLLIEMGADVKSVRSDQTPLIAASGSGHSEIVKLLLKSAAEPNLALEGFYYGTPLAAACGQLYLDIAKLLWDSGADVNANVRIQYSWHNQTALVAACSSPVNFFVEVNEESFGPLGSHRVTPKDIVRQLLYWGADVNDKGDLPSSALRKALNGGIPEVLSILLDAGANTGSKEDPDGIYQFAIQKFDVYRKSGLRNKPRYQNILRLLNDHLDLQKQRDENGFRTDSESEPSQTAEVMKNAPETVVSCVVERAI